MLNVLRTQLFRLKKSKLFWAMFIVCAVLPFVGMLFTTALLSFLVSVFSGEVGGALSALRSEGGRITMSAFNGLASLGSTPVLFSIICSSIFLSGEFSGGAIRNMVLANKSRTQIFLSFFSVALIIGFACFGAAYVSTLTFYGAIVGFGGVTVSQAVSGCFSAMFLGMLSIALAQACVCLFLFVTRKTGATVAFPLLIIILAPSLISAVVDIVAGLKLLVGQSVSATTLSWIPLYNMDMFNAAAVDGAIVGKIALYNVPLAAIFATLGWLAIYKADLK